MFTPKIVTILINKTKDNKLEWREERLFNYVEMVTEDDNLKFTLVLDRTSCPISLRVEEGIKCLKVYSMFIKSLYKAILDQKSSNSDQPINTYIKNNSFYLKYN